MEHRSWYDLLPIFLTAAAFVSFLLKEKKQKFKKEGMLPPAGHTPGSPPLSVGPTLF